MMLRPFLFCALLGLVLPAVAQAAPRAPTGPWVVDFSASQCVASRPYGTEEDPLYLVLKRPPLGEVMQLSVVSKGNPLPTQAKAKITIDGAPPIATSMLVYGKKPKRRIHQANLAAADFERAKEIKAISVESQGLDETFAISKMKELLPVIEQCVADLRKVWNVSDATGETSALPVRAKSDLGRLFASKDYPAIALRRGDSGTVAFVLLVDEAGRVADCTVTETSGVAVLDAQSCIVLREDARFDPATGADGKPARDAVTGRVIWKIAGW